VVLATAPASSATTQAAPADQPAPAAAIEAPRTPLWPTVAWYEPSRQDPVWRTSTQPEAFTDQQATALRWWGPPVADRRGGTFWWWGAQANPQLLWIPPRPAPTWRQSSRTGR
jgi:hypothetical protein